MTDSFFQLLQICFYFRLAGNYPTSVYKSVLLLRVPCRMLYSNEGKTSWLLARWIYVSSFGFCLLLMKILQTSLASLQLFILTPAVIC